MVVQHNLTAMNSNRMLGITTKSQAKSTEKLSSGYKINRAADDAAGLSISEKMRKQIRGLSQASANAQDGISAVQTAEGALTEVHDMLQRMNELAVKAANGTQSKDDRSYIQAEVDQLVIEIDRVATTTKFNEMYLLKGTNSTTDKTGELTYSLANSAVQTQFAGLTFDATTGETELAVNKAASPTNATQGDDEMVPDYDAAYNTGRKLPTYMRTDVQVGDKYYAVIDDIKPGSQTKPAVLGPPAVAADTKEITLTYEKIVSELSESGKTDATNGTKFFKTREEMIAAIKSDINTAAEGSIKQIVDQGDKLIVSAFADLNKALDVSLHVGADSTKDNKIGLQIDMMSARGLNINGIRVDGESFDNATNAIDIIAAAIQHVSTQRSSLGAVQNRLEHTINNLDNVVENTQSAESAIRDTDMAKQMVTYSNNNILAQAGQAMLAQSNQANQGVLSLLG